MKKRRITEESRRLLGFSTSQSEEGGRIRMFLPVSPLKLFNQGTGQVLHDFGILLGHYRPQKLHQVAFNGRQEEDQDAQDYH